MTHTGSGLGDLTRLAREAGAELLAREAEALVERLRDGRFYVTCVGQFKRGKSALINALVGQPLLPTGVIPVTSVVTVVRHGAQVAARLRLGDHEWEECDPRTLAHYVSEEHNPANGKDVTGVEVFVPSPLLAHGLCLVDTPGIGSVSAANTAATRDFLPRVDAALVVLGADPPISGEELALVVELTGTIADVIVVLNKADRLSPAERAEAVRFTERVLADRVGRDLGPVYEVSALERLSGTGPLRDWPALVARLEHLARRGGADLVHAAGQRGLGLLRARLLRELDQQLAALTRPVEETRARVALIEQTGAAEGALGELAHRLAAVQDRLAGTFTDARDRFFAGALTAAQAELRAVIRSTPAGSGLRGGAIAAAAEITRRWIERWRREEEPRAEALFREGFARFVELVDEFGQRLRAVPGLAEATEALVELGFTGRSGFHYTEMLTVAPASAGSQALDLLRTRAGRARAVERDAVAYLTRLLEVNSTRLKNDFLQRLDDSRAQLERALRARMKGLSASARRALEQARAAHADGAEAMGSTVQALQRLRSEAGQLVSLACAPPVPCAANQGRIGAPVTEDGAGA